MQLICRDRRHADLFIEEVTGVAGGVAWGGRGGKLEAVRSRLVADHREKILELVAHHRATDVRVSGPLARAG
jgi:hypothetical protein